MPLSSTIRLSEQVTEEVGEGGLEGVVVIPVREVLDVVFAEFDGQVFAGVAPRDEPSASHRVGKRSARHAER